MKRILAVVVAALMIFSLMPSAMASEREDLLFALDFEDETSIASIGTATQSGTVDIQSEGGISGNYGVFNGSSGNYFNARGADNSNLLAGRDTFSVTFFARADSGNTTWWMYAAPNGNTQSYRNEKYIGMLQIGSSLSAEIYNNSGSRPAVPKAVATQGEWHHYALVIDNYTSALYVDGVLNASGTQSFLASEMLGDDPLFQIGKANWGSGEWATGAIDEFHVYGGALTASEVMDEFANRFESDEECAAALLDTVTLSRTERLTKNIALPQLAGYLTWTSSDETVIGADGVISRGTALASAILTASVTYGSATLTRDFPVTVLPAPTDDEYAYLFAYFTGNGASQERLYYGVSIDGYNFTALNGGSPILRANSGTGCLRDPYVFKGEDGFYYCLATDMRSSTNGSWDGDTAIFVWKSSDLIRWSIESNIDFAAFAGFENVGRAWAPQAIWCPEKNAYMVYLALRVNNGEATVMYRTYATDLCDASTYSVPELFWPMDKSFAAIDGDIIYSEAEGCYYMYFKDETSGGIKLLRAALLSGVWTDTGIVLPRKNPSSGSTVAVEGSSIYKLNGEDRWNLIMDAYTSGFFIMEETENLTDFTQLGFGEYSFDFTPRHGSVLSISKTQYENICRAFGGGSDEEESEEAMLRYTFENGGSDSSGNGYDANLLGGAQIADGRNGGKALYLSGDGAFAALPAGVASNLRDMTVSTWVKSEEERFAARIFDIGSGTTKYMFLSPYLSENTRFAITTNGSSNDQKCSADKMAVNEWTHVALTLKDNVASLYINGVLSAQNTEVTLDPCDIGFSECNYIGKSNYSSDAYFKGYIGDFRIYNRALSYGEISVLAEKASTNIIGASGEGIKGYNTVIDTENRTVELTVYPDTDLSSVTAVFELQDANASVTPSGALDLTNGATVTVTAGGESALWNITAVKRGNSVLGEYGCFGDPNIVVLDGKYYIYPTTDGNTGWRSTYFKAFSSPDLVHWTDEGTILDFANIDWTGGIYAWAPTACEYKGKYYYYYSGGTYNGGRSIGVAVADSPSGPFTDLGKPLVPSGSYGGQMIDPQVFIDDDGTPYLYWGNGGLYVARLNTDMVSFASEVYTITPDNFTEGIFVIKRGGKYYFTWSQGDTRAANYCVRYGVSDSPITRPVGSDVILSQNNTNDSRIMCTAHHSIINVPNTDEWYICYHRFNIPTAAADAAANNGYSHFGGSHREVCIDKMEFDENGAIKTVYATMEGVMESVNFKVAASVSSVSLEGAAKGDDVAIDVYTQNNGAAEDVQLTAALYDKNGMLCAASEKKLALDALSGVNTRLEITMPEAFDAHTLSVFVWDKNMKPLAAKEERDK